MQENPKCRYDGYEFNLITQKSLRSTPLGPQLKFSENDDIAKDLAEVGDPRMDLWEWKIVQDDNNFLPEDDGVYVIWLHGFNRTKLYFSTLAVKFPTEEAAKSFVENAQFGVMVSGCTTPML